MQNAAEESYRINFFKPTSGLEKSNNRLIILFVVIWAAAVFGFQFLLIATNEPTAEASLTTFEELWPEARTENLSPEDRRDFAISLLLVLGKNLVLSAEDKAVLKEAFSLAVQPLMRGEALTPESVKVALALNDEGMDLVLSELLPYALVEVTTAQYHEALPAVIKHYATHPRGPLTDFVFLGFPFHYWFTAQFLLILFVLLCLIYALRIEKIYKRHGFLEEVS